MVCASCEKKLNKIAAPDKWKDGAQNTLSVREMGTKNAVGRCLSSPRGSVCPRRSQCEPIAWITKSSLLPLRALRVLCSQSGKVRVGQNKLLANRAKFKPYEKQLKCQVHWTNGALRNAATRRPPASLQAG